MKKLIIIVLNILCLASLLSIDIPANLRLDGQLYTAANSEKIEGQDAVFTKKIKYFRLGAAYQYQDLLMKAALGTDETDENGQISLKKINIHWQKNNFSLRYFLDEIGFFANSHLNNLDIYTPCKQAAIHAYEFNGGELAYQHHNYLFAMAAGGNEKNGVIGSAKVKYTQDAWQLTVFAQETQRDEIFNRYTFSAGGAFEYSSDTLTYMSAAIYLQYYDDQANKYLHRNHTFFNELNVHISKFTFGVNNLYLHRNIDKNNSANTKALASYDWGKLTSHLIYSYQTNAKEYMRTLTQLNKFYPRKNTYLGLAVAVHEDIKKSLQIEVQAGFNWELSKKIKIRH